MLYEWRREFPQHPRVAVLGKGLDFDQPSGSDPSLAHVHLVHEHDRESSQYAAVTIVRSRHYPGFRARGRHIR